MGASSLDFHAQFADSRLSCDNACRMVGFRGHYTSDFMAEAFAMMVARAKDQVLRADWAHKSEICKHLVHDVECSFADSD